MVSVFSHAQEGEFYIRLVSVVRETFADLVKIGESLEEGIRTRKIVKTPTSFGSSTFPTKKKEDVTAVCTYYINKLKKKFKHRNVLSFPPSPSFHPIFYAQS